MDRNPEDLLRLQLCSAGAFLGSVSGESVITVEKAATECRMSAETARRLFPTDEELRLAVRDFVTERLRAYTPVAPGASIEQLIEDFTNGAYRFSSTEGHAYRMLIKFPPTSDFYPDAVKDFAAAMTAHDFPDKTVKIRAFILGLNGLCFLTVFGVAKGLTPAVKSRLFATYAESCIHLIHTEHIETLEPSTYTHVKKVALADPERTRLYEAAIKESFQNQAAAPTLEGAARIAAMPLSRASALIDGDGALLEEMIQYAEDKLAHYMRTQFEAIKGNDTRLNRLKAMAMGYVGYAICHPEEYLVGFLWANTPIVPNSPLRKKKSSAGSDVFGLLLSIIGEESPNPLTQFEFAFMSWSLVSGIADIMSNGFLSDLPRERQWAAVSDLIDAFCSVF